MHTLCTLFLGVCTPCADFFWVHANFFQTLKIQPFSPSCTGSFRIPVSLIGLITSPTSLDRKSKVLFSVVLKGLKSLHSLHGVHAVCTGLPPDVLMACVPGVLTSCVPRGCLSLDCSTTVRSLGDGRVAGCGVAPRWAVLVPSAVDIRWVPGCS